MDRYGDAVADVRIDGPVPRDIDTWEDYRLALAEAGLGAS